METPTQQWWSLVVRGVLILAFGVITIAVPAAAVWALVLLFGIYCLADGAASLGAFFRIETRGRWILGVVGLLSLVAGLFAILWPSGAAAALFLLIATWAVLVGLLEVVGAIAYSDAIEGEWAIVLSGLLWVAFGLMLLIWPAAGALAVLSLIATFAILRGIVLMVAGARLRRLEYRLRTSPVTRHIEIHGTETR